MALDNWLPTLWNDGSDRRDPFQALRKQMDDVFNDWAAVVPRPTGTLGNWHFQPSMDVSETDKDITIKAELPGVEQKDIDVALVGNQLTIKGEKRTQAEKKTDEKGCTYHRLERTYGAFQRPMMAPFDIDPSRVDAKFKDGVLRVVLPKPAEVQKKTKLIEIKNAA